MLVCVALGALFANGATGPLAALMTLILPPEIKSFALSVFEFVAFLLGPVYSTIMGVGLQVRLLSLFRLKAPQSAGTCACKGACTVTCCAVKPYRILRCDAGLLSANMALHRHAASKPGSELPDSHDAMMQAIAARNEKRYSGVSVDGTGPSSKLAADKRTFVAACVMLAIGLVAALAGSAVFFLWASWGIRHDIACAPHDCSSNLKLAPQHACLSAVLLSSISLAVAF